MTKNLLRIISDRGRGITAVVLLLLIQTVVAQDSLLLRDYNFVQRQDAWLGSPNAAGLTRFAGDNIATATLSLTLGGGSLRDYSEAKHLTEAQAGVEALHRLSRRTVVYGAIGYDNFSGSDMTGSVFVDPSRKPFDITELSADNAGDKHRDTYRLTGGVGVDLWRGYAIGAQLGYKSANYAKYKDLRHKNKLMDLKATAGIYAPMWSWLHLGAHYAYHRNTESLSFSVNGKNEVVYKSLINYGAYFGSVEQFGNDGYTDQTREMPLFEEGHGVGMQAEVCPVGGLSVLGTYTYHDGKGYYGRKSPYTITYTQHKRRTHDVALTIGYRTAEVLHRIEARYALERLAGKAETVRGQKNEAGATYYEYYDPVESADKQWRDLSIGYTADLHIHGEVPEWQLAAGYAWHQRKQVAYLFPFYRHQHLRIHQLSASAARHLFLKKGILSLCVGIGWKKGCGAPYSDGLFVEPDPRQSPPATMDDGLYREYNALTATQWRCQARAQYAFVFPGTRLKTHAALVFSGTRGKGQELGAGIGRSLHRAIGSLILGCTF